MHRLELELVIDSFAGGGGASLGIEEAIGRPVDVAINHDRAAIAMHEANHPETRHYQEDVWQVDPLLATGGRPVALLWLSPDCTHHSKARGGKPRDKGIRGLAWVGLRWAARARPRVIILENVEEFRTWGPLNRRRRPKRNRKGETFDRWVSQLRGLGYEVEWRELRACDFGSPTSRRRLFVIARCDGEPITWPEPTHSNKPMLGLVPYRTAAECIDWSIPCPSIFERPKPLAAATLRRIANGIKRYVIEAERPFVINLTHGGRLESVDEPFATITGAHRGEKALVAPYLAGVGGPEYSGKPVRVDEPMRTLTVENHRAVVTPFLAGITHNKSGGQTTPVDAPMPVVTAGGNHLGEVRAFLAAYYGNDKDGQAVSEPFRTVTSKERFGLVTVEGEPYAIVDIGMRMLAPRELFRAQGFPDGYLIKVWVPEHDEWRRNEETREWELVHRKAGYLTKTDQIRMCGNSVCPPIARALVEANVGAAGQRNLWAGYELAAAGGGS